MTDDLVKPVAHRYRYKDPFTGIPVWRGDCDLWNGQRPYEREALYNLEALQAERDLAHAAAIELAISHFEVDDLDSERTDDHCKYAQKELRTLHTEASRAAIERIKREAREEALSAAANKLRIMGDMGGFEIVTALIEKDKDDD